MYYKKTTVIEIDDRDAYSVNAIVRNKLVIARKESRSVSSYWIVQIKKRLQISFGWANFLVIKRNDLFFPILQLNQALN